MITIPAWVLWLTLGLAGGAGGVLGFQALADDEPAEVVAAVAAPIEAATREAVTDAETRAAVATAPAVNLAVEAAVLPEAAPGTVALAAYALCLAAAQGKVEGSAAFQCQERGKVLDEAVRAGLAPQPDTTP